MASPSNIFYCPFGNRMRSRFSNICLIWMVFLLNYGSSHRNKSLNVFHGKHSFYINYNNLIAFKLKVCQTFTAHRSSKSTFDHRRKIYLELWTNSRFVWFMAIGNVKDFFVHGLAWNATVYNSVLLPYEIFIWKLESKWKKQQRKRMVRSSKQGEKEKIALYHGCCM